MTKTPARPFRSRDWFADPARSDMAALYLERFMNYGVGLGHKPEPIYLKAGDAMHLGIARLGEQRQTVKPFKLD